MSSNKPPHKHSVMVSVAELRIGMYVAKLDKDWLETPFLYQGFVITDQEDIDQLADCCEYVWIDPVQKRSEYEQKLTLSRVDKRSRFSLHRVPLEKEYKKARQVFYAAREATETFLGALVLSDKVDVKTVNHTIKNCVGSILQNPDAITWLSKIRNSDSYTSDHSLNVCILAVVFGRYLGKSRSELELLGLCGLLHDVGKMHISSEILNKSGKLTDEEWNIIRTHPEEGRNILLASGVNECAVDVAYSHHEQADGKGYPRGLKGNKMSEFAKIIAIVDAYDAMTAERCYSSTKTSTQAVKVIYQSRGQHFDEKLAQEFAKSIGLYPAGTIVELVNGFVGIVIEHHSFYRHLPKVLVVKDCKHKNVDHKLFDLSETESGKLSHSYLVRKDHVDGFAGVYIKDFVDYLATPFA